MTIPESVIAFLLLFLCLLLFYRIFLCFSGKKRASDFPSDCVSGASKTIGDREVQEDEYGIKTAPEGIMAVLADGMGKHFGGKIAAGTAVEAFLQIFEDGSAFYNPQYSFRRALAGRRTGLRLCRRRNGQRPQALLCRSGKCKGGRVSESGTGSGHFRAYDRRAGKTEIRRRKTDQTGSGGSSESAPTV